MARSTRWDVRKIAASALFVAAALVFTGSFAGVAPASADSSKVVTGTVTIPAGEVFEILPPEPGRVFFGTVTIRGFAAAPNDPSKYDMQVTNQGQVVHITGSPTHISATRDQNAAFVGESLQVHNFSSLVAPPGYDITIVFGVAFDRKKAESP